MAWKNEKDPNKKDKYSLINITIIFCNKILYLIKIILPVTYINSQYSISKICMVSIEL